ncbi:penicillin-binding protein activator [Gilvimarinus polysaccharolyticus]|uniref:penicillin-binding protein activator n=1 Tax=Gilvimarinus polysaccharolyticus TaxID=863921 RepID=UPI00067361F1|nr:penicillin-binding protein activator [Gilvimarinus polysaccharolyticus]
MHNNLTRVLFALSLGLILTACAPQSPRQNNAGEAGMSSQALENQINQLVDQARQAGPNERTDYLLQAAELLRQQGQIEWAYSLLQPLAPHTMSDAMYLKYLQSYSAIAYAGDYFFEARDALTSARLEQLWRGLQPDLQYTLLARRAQLSSLLGDYQASLATRVELGYLLRRDELYLNNESIWQDLMSLSTSELAELAINTDNPTLSSWAKLAQVTRDSAANLNRQLDRVELWRMQHPNHPANIELPSDLQLLEQLIARQPKSIALLLPQRGRLASAASAVRDGFLAAYFAERSAEQNPTIRQYDTDSTDINQLYEQAVAEGAELIIGPLTKENVDALAMRPNLSVPILALNYREQISNKAGAANPDGSSVVNIGDLKIPPLQLNLPGAIPLSADTATPTRNYSNSGTNHSLFAPALYQFGLAAEDEARQIARHAHLQGHRRAMIIAPDIDWAERSVDAFIQQWQQLDGEIIALSRYIGAGDYSEVIKRALLVDDSEQRHDQLRKIIFTNSHFEPRRRKDVEMIFLIANPPQARQIKPTLAFHYAGDVPVFATSQIYNGTDNPKSDRDLNGIRFNTLPWLFADNPETQAIKANTDAPPAYERLHAMGADAYHLYPRLPQLKHLPQTRVLGATGTLSMQPDGRIVREQIWAEFSDGIAKPITSSVIQRASSTP